MTKIKTVFIFLALICIYLAIRTIASDITNNEFHERIHKILVKGQNQIKGEIQTSIRKQLHIPNEIQQEKDLNKWLGEKEEITANMERRNLIDLQLHPIRQKRQAFHAKAKLWPRTINYEINFPELESDILTAIKYWEDNSCLTFREDASAKERIRISEGHKNLSMVGRLKGNICEVTLMSINSVGVMMHEIGHALGFTHSHQRTDRDEYLEVYESKISEDWKKEYIINPDIRLHSDVPYDPASIMSYAGYMGRRKDRIQVMVTKDARYKRALGQRIHPSFCDLLLLNIYYDCEDVCEKFETKCHLGGGFPNPKDCTKCICPSGFGGNSCNKPAGTCGSILEATTDIRLFAESVGNHYEYHPPPNYHQSTIGSHDQYYPSQFYHNYHRPAKRIKGIWMGGNAQCHWHIRARSGHSIKLTVHSLTASCDETCDYGFAELKIKRDMRPAGIRICCQEDLDSNGQMILESETNLMVISIYGNVRLEFDYHSFGNGDSSSSSIRWPEDESKSIRSLMTKSIRTSQKEPKSIRVQHVESIRPQKKSESIRTQGKLKSIRSRQGEIK